MPQAQDNPGHGPAPEGADNHGDGTLDAAVQEEIRRLTEADGSDNEPGDGQSDPDNPDGDQQADDGEGDQQADEGDEGQQAGPTIEIEFNGKKFNVPAELKDGFLMQSDYSRKTAEHARKEAWVENRAQAANQLFESGQKFAGHFAALNQVDSEAAEIHGYLNANPRLSAIDPVAFSTLTGQLQLLQSKRAGIGQHLAGYVQQMDQYEAQTRQESVANAARVASERVPNWSPVTQKAIAQYAANSGMRAETFAALDAGFDPMALVIIDKARLYDEMQAKRPGIKDKIANAAPALRPGPAQGERTQKQTVDVMSKRLKSSGSVNDAVALELSRMGGRRR